MEIKKVIVFCKNGNDAKCYYEELRDSMQVVKQANNKLEFRTDYEFYKFVNANTRSIDGLRAHAFMLSPHFLRRGSLEKINSIISEGRNITAIYP